MRALVLLSFCLATLGAGCADQAGPEVVEIQAPDEIYDGTSTDVTIRVRGPASTQVSIALSASAGAAEPPSMIVLTDSDGAASFRTTFTAAEVGGDETLIASVSTLGGDGHNKTRPLKVNDLERVGTPTAIGVPAAQEADILLAYPITLAAAGTIIKLGVFAPTQPGNAPVNAHLGLYKTLTATTIEALAPPVTKTISPGRNEIDIPPQQVPAGAYWLVIQYAGTPLIYRSETDIIVTRFRRSTFTAPLTTTITDLVQSAPPDGTGARVYRRSLYVAVRP